MITRRHTNAAAFVLAAALLGGNAAMAIGPGEYALTGRDGSGTRIAEVRIMTAPAGTNNLARAYCGQTFYISSYAQQQMMKWVSSGHGINVEYLTADNNRRIICNIQ